MGSVVSSPLSDEAKALLKDLESASAVSQKEKQQALVQRQESPPKMRLQVAAAADQRTGPELKLARPQAESSGRHQLTEAKLFLNNSR